jgi:hypothetical protein
MDEFIMAAILDIDAGMLPVIQTGCAEVMLARAAFDPFAPSKPYSRTTGARRFNFCNYREVCEHALFPGGR